MIKIDSDLAAWDWGFGFGMYYSLDLFGQDRFSSDLAAWDAWMLRWLKSAQVSGMDTLLSTCSVQFSI